MLPAEGREALYPFGEVSLAVRRVRDQHHDPRVRVIIEDLHVALAGSPRPSTMIRSSRRRGGSTRALSGV